MQLIQQFQRIWEEEGIPLTLTTYRIMAITSQSGLIEVVPNSVSVHRLKQKAKDDPTLLGFFKRVSLRKSFEFVYFSFYFSIDKKTTKRKERKER